MLTDEMIARKIASDQNNGLLWCPRCGGRMPDKLAHGALSRHAKGVYICEMCGADEAFRDWKGNTLPLSSWKLVRSRRYMHDKKNVEINVSAARPSCRVKNLLLVGTDYFGREVLIDKLGTVWKYTEPGTMPRERHDKVYTASGNDLDGEPSLPMSDEFDYRIIDDLQED